MRTYFNIGGALAPNFPEIRVKAKNSPNLFVVHGEMPRDHFLHDLLHFTDDRNLEVEAFDLSYDRRHLKDRYVDNALSSTWSRLEVFFNVNPNRAAPPRRLSMGSAKLTASR